jgi:hypothetical protein
MENYDTHGLFAVMKTASPLVLRGTLAVLVFAEYVTFGSNPQCEVIVVAFTVAFPAV